MPAPAAFDYGIVQVMPRVERGELINVGVIVLCRARRFLGAKIELNASRLLTLFPAVDIAEVEKYLSSIPIICAGGPDSGPIGQLSQTERFHWLVAPRSTIIVVSPVHSGLCLDPTDTLERLMQTMVR